MEEASPMGEEIEKKGPITDSSESESKSEAKVILLIEDEEAHAELVRRAFKENSSEWEIHRVVNISEAFKWLEEHELPTLIITDYSLPDGTGLDLTKGAKNPEEMNVPLILLIGYSSEQPIVRSIKSDAMDYVVKDVEELRLLPWTAERVLHDWENIVKRKQAEDALRVAYKEFEEREKMKTDFLNVAYHEMKSPLASIVGYTHLLEQSELTEEQKNYVRIIGESTSQLNELIGSLLEVARLGAGKMELTVQEVSIPEIVKEVLERVKPSVDAKKQTISTVVPERVEVEGDKQKITAIFGNLILNAIKFTGENGRIDIEIEEREEEGDIRVCITDTGVGIPKGHLSKIFDRYYVADTPSTRKEGLGLGLAIVKGYVELHGGKVWTTSELGKGSKFCFTLPKRQRQIA
jgi:signal transduction histidine kinase